MWKATSLLTTRTCALGAGLLLAAGCAGETPYTGPEIAINAAPLSLPGVGDGCYGLTVKSATETVWAKSGICGHAYGAAASVSYVGPCDASGTGLHSVELVLEQLCTGTCGDAGAAGQDMGSYANPCPAGAPCIQTNVACSENADTPVTFELAVMREADQGFFDIAVNFDDIFCSAKFDCAYEGATADPGDDVEIKLLHDASGARGRTAVLGFACTAGVGDMETVLVLSDILVECFDNALSIIVLSPDADGNVDLGAAVDSSDPPPLFAASVTRGNELLNVGAASANKVYWNIMLGYEDVNPTDDPADDGSCFVYVEGTALDGADSNAANPATTPPGVTYPVVVWNIQLTDVDGERACSHAALDLGASLDGFDIETDFLVGVFYKNLLAGYAPTFGYGTGFYRYPAP